jgi:hypothetical protein
MKRWLYGMDSEGDSDEGCLWSYGRSLVGGNGLGHQRRCRLDAGGRDGPVPGRP